MAESAGKATQTSVTTPAIISCFFPVALMALTNSSLSHALICPGRAIFGALGNKSTSSCMSGPLGPFSKLVVKITGKSKNLAVSPRANTLFLNSSTP